MEASIDQNDPLDDISRACLHRFNSRRSPAVGKGGRLGVRLRRDHQPDGVRRAVGGDASHQGDHFVCRDLHGDLFGVGDSLHPGDRVNGDGGRARNGSNFGIRGSRVANAFGNPTGRGRAGGPAIDSCRSGGTWQTHHLEGVALETSVRVRIPPPAPCYLKAFSRKDPTLQACAAEVHPLRKRRLLDSCRRLSRSRVGFLPPVPALGGYFGWERDNQYFAP